MNYNKKNRNRYILRGYNKLKEDGNIDLLSKIGEDISKTILTIPSNKFSHFYFKSAINEAEIKIRQKLLVTLVNKKLNQEILISIAKNKNLIYPLPIQVLKIIKNYGIKVSFPLCYFYFYLFIIKTYLLTILNQFKVIRSLVLKEMKFDKKKYVQFVDLDYKSLPKNSTDKDSYNIINWYIKNKIKDSHLRTIKHNVNENKNLIIDGVEIINYSSFFPEMGRNNKINYLLWILLSFFRNLYELLIFRWWHILIYDETSILMRLFYSRKEFLAEEYLFSNSYYLNRPLWTYEAKRYGSKITLFFYSTNCVNFENEIGKSINVIGYNSINWPNYLVWDNYQYDFVRKVTLGESNIDIVGPIWLQSYFSISEIKRLKTIAIFDVTPVRDIIFSSLGSPIDYYRSTNNIKFLNDIAEIGTKYGFKILFKQKRQIGIHSELKYRNFIIKFLKRDNVELINSDVSAIELIKVSDMSLSMPFTSTSVIAKEYGYKTAFYDSTGTLRKNDKAAHGIKVISDISELENWVCN